MVSKYYFRRALFSIPFKNCNHKWYVCLPDNNINLFYERESIYYIFHSWKKMAKFNFSTSQILWNFKRFRQYKILPWKRQTYLLELFSFIMGFKINCISWQLRCCYCLVDSIHLFPNFYFYPTQSIAWGKHSTFCTYIIHRTAVKNKTLYTCVYISSVSS